MKIYTDISLISFFIFALFCKCALCDSQEEEDWNRLNELEKDFATNWNDFEIRPNSCPKCDLESGSRVGSDDGVALLYFKKFILNLFNRNKFQLNKALTSYKRCLVFNVVPAQLDMLETINDARDLDSVLAEVFLKVQACTDNEVIIGKAGSFELIKDILKDTLMLLKISEVQFVLGALVFVLLILWCKRRYRIGFVALFFSLLFIFGYIHTYLECNRELDMKQTYEAIELHQKLKSTTATSSSWLSWSWFSTNTQLTPQERNEHIKKSARFTLGFCRPDHVLLMYLNDIFMKQLEFLIEKTVATIMRLRESLSVYYFLVCAPMLILMIAYIMKLTFKHILSPRAWAALLHRSSPTEATQQAALKSSTSAEDDRISGANLKLLLNAINKPNIILQNSERATLPPVSGVQDVLELLDATQTTASSKSNSANSSADVQKLIDSFETIENADSKNVTDHLKVS